MALDGHGGVIISSSGDTWYGAAFNSNPNTNPTMYLPQRISSSVTDYIIPSGYPKCISIEAIKGGTANGGGTTGGWSRPIVCVS